MAKFIIGVDAFSDPEALEDEFITHTEYPRFVGEIVFVEAQELAGFKFDSINVIWNEKCEKADLAEAVREAQDAVKFYTQKSLLLDVE